MKKTKNNIIGIISDLHLQEKLGYSDFVKDGRKEEEKEILDFIVESFKDINKIVFIGDCFHTRNPSSAIIKKFVNFIERFEDKKLYIIAGNHDLLFGGHKSSIDFLKEVKNKNWTVITNEVTKIDDNVFSPYFTRTMLEVETNEEGTKKLMKMLPKGNILFAHQALSNCLTVSGQNTNIFNEIVLPKAELEKKFKLIVAGHIHSSSISKKTIITGSIFNSEVGETQKYIFKINEKTLKTEQIKLPGRGIFKAEDPTDTDLNKIPKNSIVKAIITKEISTIKINELKEKLSKFDAYVLLSQIPKKRKKLHFKEGGNLLEFSVPQLLKVYAKEKEISLERLMRGFELIKK